MGLWLSLFGRLVFSVCVFGVLSFAALAFSLWPCGWVEGPQTFKSCFKHFLKMFKNTFKRLDRHFPILKTIFKCLGGAFRRRGPAAHARAWDAISARPSRLPAGPACPSRSPAGQSVPSRSYPVQTRAGPFICFEVCRMHACLHYLVAIH